MDISTLLPLILASRSSSSDSNAPNDTANSTAKLISLFSSLQNGNKSQADMLCELARASGTPTHVTDALKNVINQNKNTQHNIVGLSPIMPFVNDDILGKLTRFFR